MLNVTKTEVFMNCSLWWKRVSTSPNSQRLNQERINRWASCFWRSERYWWSVSVKGQTSTCCWLKGSEVPTESTTRDPCKQSILAFLCLENRFKCWLQWLLQLTKLSCCWCDSESSWTSKVSLFCLFIGLFCPFLTRCSGEKLLKCSTVSNIIV